MIGIPEPSVDEKNSNDVDVIPDASEVTIRDGDVKMRANKFGNVGKSDRRNGSSREQRVKMAHACRGGPPGVPHGEIETTPRFEIDLGDPSAIAKLAKYKRKCRQPKNSIPPLGVDGPIRDSPVANGRNILAAIRNTPKWVWGILVFLVVCALVARAIHSSPKCAALSDKQAVLDVLKADKAAVKAMTDAGTTFEKIYDISAILASFDEEKNLGNHDVPCAEGSPTENGVFGCVANSDGNAKYQLGETCDAAGSASPNLSDDTDAAKKTIYPQDLRAASKTATTESHFAANVEKLLKNYRSKLIISPTRNRKNLSDSKNPNPPTIRISKDVGTCAKLTEKDRQVCVPLCCSAGSDLKVLAVEIGTIVRSYPSLKPISTESLRLCCGSATNSAAITPIEIQDPIRDPRGRGSSHGVFTVEYATTGQCRLSSDGRDPILPMQATGYRWKEKSGSEDYNATYGKRRVNYPVHVSCVTSG
eukprot:898646_1